jgi:hypothetical protein
LRGFKEFFPSGHAHLFIHVSSLPRFLIFHHATKQGATKCIFLLLL